MLEEEKKKSLGQSAKYFLNHLAFTYRDNKTIFFKYLGYSAGRVVTYPVRKIRYLFDKGEEKYQKFIAGKDEVQIEVLGNKMVLPTKDNGLTRDLIIEGIREKNSVKVFFEEYRPGMNTIDLGANLGYYLLMEAKIAQQGKGKLYAVEPNPLTFEYLKKNIALNGYKGVQLMNLGISDQKGVLPFYLAKSWNCSRFEKGPSDKDIIAVKPIKVDTLDNLFGTKKIDFIRMDVEGYEFKILKGAKKLIKRNPGMKIFFEFHAQFFNSAQRKEFVNFLKENGLEVKYFYTGDRNIFAKRTYKDILNARYTTYYLLLEAKKVN